MVKTILFLGCFLNCAANAFALCPDMRGSYSCFAKGDPDRFNSAIDQLEDSDGTTVFTWDKTELVMDAQRRPYRGYSDMSYEAMCLLDGFTLNVFYRNSDGSERRIERDVVKQSLNGNLNWEQSIGTYFFEIDCVPDP